jgi:general secretion pathway protein H
MRRGSSRPRSEAGFSLVEVLAVLVLMALVLGLVGNSIYRSLDAVKIRRAGKEVTAALRYTRGQAIINRDERYLEVNVEERSYRAPEKDAVILPEGVDMTLKTATADILDNATGRIRFFADGSSTGGRMTLTAGEREWIITVAWLTGEIEIYDGLENQ